MPEIKWETPEDKRKQNEVLKEFCKKFNLFFDNTDEYDKFDACFYRNSDKMFVGVGEVKCRENTHDKYEPFMDTSKVNSMLQYYNNYGVKPLYIYRFLDGIYYVKVDSLDLRNIKITWSGSNDKNDVNNKAPLIHVPISCLIKL